MVWVLTVDQLVALSGGFNRHFVQNRLVLKLPKEQSRVAAGLANLLDTGLFAVGRINGEAVVTSNPDLEAVLVRPVQLLTPLRRAPAVVAQCIEAEFL